MSACCIILAHVTWALARQWALFIRAAKTVTWALARDTTAIRVLNSMGAVASEDTDSRLVTYTSLEREKGR